MSAATTTTLAGVCESVRYGFTASASLEPCGPRFLRITDIVPDSLDWDSVPYCEVDDEDRERFALSPGDIVVARTGATVGYAKLIRESVEAVFASYLVRFRVNAELADPGFVGRLVESQAYKSFVQSRIGGAAQPNASAPVLGAFEFVLPPRHSQHHVAEILSAYDDLLENNRRRMTLLEDAARQLYREWFVRLRFPGHEHTRITNGVPEAWERRPLESCAIFRSGGTPSKARSEYWEGDTPWVSSGEMSETRIYDTPLHVSPEGAEAGSRLISPNTILIVVRGMSLAKEFRLATVAREMAFNQDLKALESRDGVDSLFLFHTLLDQRSGIRELATEASHGTKKLDTVVLEKLPILVADHRLQRLFRDTVAPSLAQRDNLYHQNTRLRAARDLLLPRLMSGEIAV